jgi:DNA-binding NarL/FixJ family response regulator
MLRSARRLCIAVDQLGASAPDPTCHFLQLTFPGVRIEWPDATGVAAYALHVLRGKTMKILVIDDHPLIQEALKHVLIELDASLELIQAQDASSAHAALSRTSGIDLLVLDLALPGCDGFELLADLRRDWPDIPVLVLSATYDRATVEMALDLGAMGFIPKTANAHILIDALRLVLSGGVFVPVECSTSGGGALRPRTGTRSQELGLTPRQGDVLKLLVQGKPNKLICRDLSLSEGTIKVHVSAILRALKVNNRTQVVIELARRGVRLDPTAVRPR